MYLSLIVLVAGLIAASEGCSCMPTHPQDYFCKDNTFIALVKIRGRAVSVGRLSTMEQEGNSLQDSSTVTRQEEIQTGLANGLIPTAAYDEVVLSDDNKVGRTYLRYPIKLYKAFKGINNNIDMEMKYYLYTLPKSISCTAKKLNAKSTYLVFGKIEDGRLVITACDDPHTVDWKSLSKTERRNIRGNLEQIDAVCESNCQVFTCLWTDCIPENKSECVWNKSMQRHYGRKYSTANFVCMSDASGQCEWTGVEVARLERQARKRRHSKSNKRRRHSSAKKPEP